MSGLHRSRRALSITALSATLSLVLAAPSFASKHQSHAYGPSSTLPADKALELAIKKERQQRQNVVDVRFADKQTFIKASITYHSSLLAADKDTLTLTLDLSDHDVKNIEPFAKSVTTASDWLKKRENHLEKLSVKSFNQSAGIPGYSCYQTVEETMTQAEQFAAQYPTLSEWIDIGDSWQKTQGNGGYDLQVLKITNQTISGEKPILFVHSAMHAREYSTAPLNLAFANELLTNYKTSADAQWLVDYHEIHLLFHMNPDGRKQAETGVLWRKNHNTNHCPNDQAGVDLNRNFSYFWNITNGVGSSGNECNQTYRGTSAGSEPETQAVENYVRSLFPDQRGDNINDAAPLTTSGMHIDIHSFSELMLWPWGHTDQPAPNATELQTLGRKLAYFNHYYPTQSIGLYPTDGTSDDISYGELGIPHYTFELGTDFFQDCATYQNQILPDNLAALMYAAKVVRAPYQLPAGPDVINPFGNDQSTPTIAAGDDLVISATAHDERSNEQNGKEPSQPIQSIRVTLNDPPWEPTVSPLLMQATDGAFDSPIETGELTMNTSNWSEGSHLIYFQAEDTDGNLGPVSAMKVIVGNNANPEASFVANCTDLNCTFDASGSTDDGTIDEYRWTFPDGAIRFGSTVTYGFEANGTYSVELTVVDNLGATDTQTQTVTVSQRKSSGGAIPVYLLVLLMIGNAMRYLRYLRPVTSSAN